MYKEKEKIVIPALSKDGREYAPSKKSVTYRDLADHYQHEYKTYWYVTDRNNRFVCKAKSRRHAEHIIARCNCQSVWIAQYYTEHEQILADRITINREQRQGTHNPLDYIKRRKHDEVMYSLADERRQTKLIDQSRQEKLKKAAKDKILAGGQPSSPLEKEVAQEQRILQLMKNLLEVNK